MAESLDDFKEFLKKAAGYLYGGEEEKPLAPNMNYGETPIPTPEADLSQVERLGFGAPKGLEVPKDDLTERYQQFVEAQKKLNVPQENEGFASFFMNRPNKIGAGEPVEQMPMQAPETMEREPAISTGKSQSLLPSVLPGKTGTLPGLAPEINSQAALKAAQDEVNNNMTNALLMRAGERIGAGFARQRPDYGFSDEMMKKAGIPVEQYKEQEASKMSDAKLREARQQMENEKYRKDPNSTLNQMMRGVFQKMGMNVPENATIDGMKEIIPAIDTYFRSENMKADKAAKASSAGDEKSRRRLDTLNKLVTAETASSRSAFGRAANTKQAAEKLETLVQGVNPNDVTEYQLAEMARNLDSILSNGQPTISGTQKLLPAGVAKDYNHILSYLQSVPRGAGMGAFVNNMMETVRRERELSDTQIKNTANKLLGSYSDLPKKLPEEWQIFARMHGIPEDVFEQHSKKEGTPSRAPKSIPASDVWDKGN